MCSARRRININGNHEIDAADKVFEMGEAGDRPVVGDWDGDGRDDYGIVLDGVDLSGLTNLRTWFLDTNRDIHANSIFQFGVPGDKPVVGRWLFPEATIIGPGGEIFDNTPAHAVDFGTLPRGSLAADRRQDFTVRNDGSAPLTFQFNDSGTHDYFAFGASSDIRSGITVGAGQSETFHITMSDAIGGQFTDTFTFNNSDPNEHPFEIIVEGGITGPIASSPTASTGPT